VLRRPGSRAALLEAVATCRRVVLLGDIVELRHDPLRDALAAAEPVLRELGQALGSAGEVAVVAGNHDHRLVRGWLERRALRDGRPALELQNEVTWTVEEPLEQLARWLAPATVRAFYPGVWLREDVYASHGHYSDRHTTVPILERLGAGAMARLVPEPAGGPRTPEQYEATLGPMYAWIDAVAQSGGIRGRGGAGLQVRVWNTLRPATGGGRAARLRAGALGLALPAAVAALNRAGLGPLEPDVSGRALRRGGLVAFAQVLERLRARPPYAIFGHTHRAGPLPGDEPAEWRTPGGTALINSGCWVREESFLAGDERSSPYRPGFAVRVDDEGPPQLLNLLDGRGPSW
jgi:hypothetical protein